MLQGLHCAACTNDQHIQVRWRVRAGIIACFCCFDLPQFRGARLAAVACLLWLFGAAGLACTYLLSFAFSVRACTRRACSGNGSPLLLHALAQTFSRAC